MKLIKFKLLKVQELCKTRNRVLIYFYLFSELEFKKGETIHLLQLIDENWIEGEIHDQIGIFPISYIEVGNMSPCFQ